MDKVVFALGFFDGVHLGHQALLTAARELAREVGATPGAVTFSNHPDGLVFGAAPALLNTPRDRDRLLEGYGVEKILELPFDKEMMNTPWEAFLEKLLNAGAAGFVCGDDFRFGFRGIGTAEKLMAFCRERNLPCAIVPQQEVDGVRVSSTHIRQLLENGEMERANRFLGHGHILSGQVVPGRQLGRTIGIPTANILLPEGLVTPKLGVYAAKATVDGKTYLAVTNIGSRPTVGGHQVRAESWLLDFQGDLYGKTVTLEFLEVLRPERKFDSLEELREQIFRDAQRVKELTIEN